MASQDLTIIINTKGDVKGINKVDNGIKNLGGTIKGGAVTLAKWGIAAGAAFAAAGGAATVFALKSAANIQQLRVAIDSMTGSAEDGAQIFGELTQIAKKTPFQIEDLALATKTLIQYGSTADSVTNEMRMLGDIALGNRDNFQRLSLAFGQVQAKGKLTGEEVRQMVNAGFNPLQAIAEKTGRSMRDLEDDMRKGEISFQDVKYSMTEATSEGGKFFEGMEKGSQTMTGLFSTLIDTIGITAREIVGLSEEGDVIEGSLFALIQDNLPKIIDLFTEWGEKLQPLIQDGIMKLIEEVGNLWANVLIPLGEWLRTDGVAAWKAIEPFVQVLIDEFIDLIEVLMEFWNANKDVLIPALKQLAIILGFLAGTIIFGVIKAAKLMIAIFDHAANKQRKWQERWQRAIDSFNSIKNAIKGAWEWAGRLVDKIGELAGKIGEIAGGGLGKVADFLGIGAQNGLDMVVPPGHPNDSFPLPLNVTSGERVTVTPAGQAGPSDNSKTTTINNYFPSGSDSNSIASRLAFQFNAT